MPTTADYLADLKAQQTALAANLTAKGVSAAASEKLNTLVPKVLQIESNAHCAKGVFVPAADTTVLSVQNLSFLPRRVAIYCGDAFTVTPSGATKGYHGVIAIDRNRTVCLSVMYRTVDNTLNGFSSASSALFSAVTLQQGSFSVSNMQREGVTLYFAAGKSYFWVACDNT